MIIGLAAVAAILTLPLLPGGAHAQAVCEVSSPSGDLSTAKSLFASSCPGLVRRDCDPAPGGGWRCSSGVIGANAPASPASVPPEPGPPTPPASPNGGGGVGRLAADDLLVLHYDNCPDRDDGHAMAAAYTLTRRLGLSPLVVNGTCGASIPERYQPSSSSVVLASFGSALNALTDPARALSRSTAAWGAVLAGERGRVWVAEGGPSDFTARVLRALALDSPGLDLKRVRVVQHSSWNEDNTDVDSLRHVRRVAGYIRLADGNLANATADLNQLSERFVAAARSSRFSRAWDAAFDYLDPNRRLDFSDTVELLHIVGDSTTRNPEDFAERYLR